MQNIVIPEILAPAGGRDQFFAALHSGADGVYLGMKKFNARARAENFSREDLAELMPLARQHGMKVLVTLNILIKEDELSQVIEQLIDLERVMVDAVIIQDVGVLSLIQKYAPNLRIHGSTQMAIHNLAGIIQAQKMGLSRVVLAREITATELIRMRRYLDECSLKTGEKPIELEVFCHGSLCYSYSGLCFFSGSADSRSGNRGECAYTCRKPYKIVSEEGHGFLFSMRDLDTSQHLDQLVKAGVHTLKIEGRKKDAQYVTSTVNLYRQKMDEIFGTPTGRTSHAKPLSEQHRAQIAEHVDLSFQRARTSFFLGGRYRENVIDLDHASHQGIEVAKVERVHFEAGLCSIEVVTQKPLARFDGLRIIPQSIKSPQDHGLPWEEYLRRYHNEHHEFSLREYRVLQTPGDWAKEGCSGTNKNMFDILPGTRLRITFPLTKNSAQFSPGVHVGDGVYKVRSQQFKDQVSALCHPPQDHRPRSWYGIDLQIDFTSKNSSEPADRGNPDETQGGEISGLVKASLWGQEWAVIPFTLPTLPARGPSRLAQDLESELRIFGDWSLEAQSFRIHHLPQDLFVKRSAIKNLKRTLGPQIAGSYHKWLENRIKQYHVDRHSSQTEDPSRALDPPTLTDHACPSFVVKTDDLALVDALGGFLGSNPHAWHQVKEVIFEPKKGRLEQVRPEHFLQRLGPLKGSGIPWRLALPTVMRGWDEPLVKLWITAALDMGCRRFEIGNLGSLEFVRQLSTSHGVDAGELDIHGDFTLYALNSQATSYLKSLGLKGVSLSIEDDRPNMEAHLAQLARLKTFEKDFKLTLIAYKDTPLFIAEACGLTALHGGCPTAKVCGYRTLEVENTEKERFFVAHETCKSIVYSAEAMSITHHLSQLLDTPEQRSPLKFINQIRLDFLTRPYRPEEFREICQSAFAAHHLPRTHEANFARRLL